MRNIRFSLIFFSISLLLMVTLGLNGHGLIAYIKVTAVLAVSTVVAELLARGKSVAQVSLSNYVVGVCLSTVLVWIVSTLALASVTGGYASFGEFIFDSTLVFLIGVAPVLALLRKRELR